MSARPEQCVSEEPTHKKQCTLPANHDVHRNAGTAWSTDHEAWRAEMDAKDARIAELEARVDRFKKQRAGWSGISDLRAEANEYEAERDRLRARLTGVSIHAHRLANCIGPGTPAWTALTDLRAALAQPAPEETP